VLDAFRHHVVDLWRLTLNRRSQKASTSGPGMTQIAKDLLSAARISQPWPSVRFAAKHPREHQNKSGAAIAP